MSCKCRYCTHTNNVRFSASSSQLAFTIYSTEKLRSGCFDLTFPRFITMQSYCMYFLINLAILSVLAIPGFMIERK